MDDNDGSWKGFNATEMDIMVGCLDLARNSWNSWIDNDNLPPNWEPHHAHTMLEYIEGIMQKFRDIGVMVPGDEPQPQEEEQHLPDNVYQFPNTGSNSEEE